MSSHVSAFPSLGTPATPATPANIVQSLPDWAAQISNTDTVAAVAQILQSPQGQQVSLQVLSEIWSSSNKQYPSSAFKYKMASLDYPHFVNYFRKNIG